MIRQVSLALGLTLLMGLALEPVATAGAPQGGVEECYGWKGSGPWTCLNPCPEDCSAWIVNTPWGPGADCGCAVDPNPCCDLLLVPPGSGGALRPFGECETAECLELGARCWTVMRNHYNGITTVKHWWAKCADSQPPHF